MTLVQVGFAYTDMQASVVDMWLGVAGVFERAWVGDMPAWALVVGTPEYMLAGGRSVEVVDAFGWAQVAGARG